MFSVVDGDWEAEVSENSCMVAEGDGAEEAVEGVAALCWGAESSEDEEPGALSGEAESWAGGEEEQAGVTSMSAGGREELVEVKGLRAASEPQERAESTSWDGGGSSPPTSMSLRSS